MAVFEKKFQVGWANVDFNSHMRNTAYLDFAVDTRLAYFAGHGFPQSEFSRLKFGPVVKSDYVEFYRELQLLEYFRVTFEVSGLSEDASHFRIVNNFFKKSGEAAAKVVSNGGWLNLETRRLVAPPEVLKKLMHNLVHTSDFENLESSVRAS